MKRILRIDYDSFSVSYARRVMILKGRETFNELLDIRGLLGGGLIYVR
ncbi:MAG: hypothetical protein AB2417_07095 [Clostridiaceae bacterium]